MAGEEREKCIIKLLSRALGLSEREAIINFFVLGKRQMWEISPWTLINLIFISLCFLLRLTTTVNHATLGWTQSLGAIAHWLVETWRIRKPTRNRNRSRTSLRRKWNLSLDSPRSSHSSRNKLNVEFRLIYLCHPPITSTNHSTSNLQLTMCVLLPIIDLIYQTMEVSSRLKQRAGPRETVSSRLSIFQLW